jgi:molecular chaperone HtpG
LGGKFKNPVDEFESKRDRNEFESQEGLDEDLKKLPNENMAVSTDEYAVQQPKEFVGRRLKSTTKEGLEIDDEDENKKIKELKADFEPLTKLMKEVLGTSGAGLASSRLVDAPRVLTTSECDWSANRGRIMKAQALRVSSMTSHMDSKKAREVHPMHSITAELKKKASADKSSKTVEGPTWLLFDTSLLTSASTWTSRRSSRAASIA